jgi:hypothetical protein
VSRAAPDIEKSHVTPAVRRAPNLATEREGGAMPKTAAFWMITAVLLGRAAPVRAVDVWESPSPSDDTSATSNILRPGVVQGPHDLQGTPPAADQDWMRVVLKQGHSYQARVTGGAWRQLALPSLPTFDLVDQAGTVLIGGSLGSEDIDHGSDSIGRTVSFTASNNANVFLRASASTAVPTSDEVYYVSFHDTTLLVPRWNNTSTQTTVLLLQNTTNAPVGGTVRFQDATGAPLLIVGVNVPRNGVQVLSTSAFPALAGKSGSAEIAQNGGYGALAGKAVALESATGFTFDTPIQPVR